MPKLQISGDDLSHEEIAQALLVEAGVSETLPTDHSAVLEFLGLKQLSFDFAEVPGFVKDGPILAEQLRAALSINERLVVTHNKLGAKRERWSVLHEVGHFILPDHLDKIFLDDDRTLSIWTKSRLEREANRVAAELMFQGNRFTEESLDHPLSSQTVLDLAPTYDASYESAMRRYVERHALPCAVIVYEKSPGSLGDDIDDTKYRLHYAITSAPFKRRFFPGLKSDAEFSAGSDILRVHGTHNIGNIKQTELVVENPTGPAWRFQTEIFTNGYKIFQLIVKPLK